MHQTAEIDSDSIKLLKKKNIVYNNTMGIAMSIRNCKM